MKNQFLHGLFNNLPGVNKLLPASLVGFSAVLGIVPSPNSYSDVPVSVSVVNRIDTVVISNNFLLSREIPMPYISLGSIVNEDYTLTGIPLYMPSVSMSAHSHQFATRKFLNLPWLTSSHYSILGLFSNNSKKSKSKNIFLEYDGSNLISYSLNSYMNQNGSYSSTITTNFTYVNLLKDRGPPIIFFKNELDPKHSQNGILSDSIDCDEKAYPLNCDLDIYPILDSNNKIKLTVRDISPNASDCANHHNVKVKNKWGSVIWERDHITGKDSILNNISLCSYVGQSLTVEIDNGIPGCVSNLNFTTFPKVSLHSAFHNNAAFPNIPTYQVSRRKLTTYVGLVPSPDSHRPTVSVPCNPGGGLGYYGLESHPDWTVGRPCDDNTDTAEVIYRRWEVFNNSGLSTTLLDTIVVLRWPMFGPQNFIGLYKDSVSSGIDTISQQNVSLKRYFAHKQILGVKGDDFPITDDDILNYKLSPSIIETAYKNAANNRLIKQYLDCIIIKKGSNPAREYTIRDILDGSYHREVSPFFPEDIKSQLLVDGPLGEYMPILFLKEGDELLAADGRFEKVTRQWFKSGIDPFWFSGGWPLVYGSGDLVKYQEGIDDSFLDCQVRLFFPDLTNLEANTCIAICLDQFLLNDLNGITITQETINQRDSCPIFRKVLTTIYQDCWAKGDLIGNFRICQWREFDTAQYRLGNLTIQPISEINQDSAQQVYSLAKKWILNDTVGPTFNFLYPMDNGVSEIECESICTTGPWDHEEKWIFSKSGNNSIINQSTYESLSSFEQLLYSKYPSDIGHHVLSGRQYPSAKEWELCNASLYAADTDRCGTALFLPSIQASDLGSGIANVTATILDTTIFLTEVKDDEIYTYIHTGRPLEITIESVDQILEVVYRATDSCQNTSEWSKYLTFEDVIPPLVVIDSSVTIDLNLPESWVSVNSLDGGSRDNCQLENLLVRRSDWWVDSSRFDFVLADTVTLTFENILEHLGFRDIDRAVKGENQCGDYNFNLLAINSFFKSKNAPSPYFLDLIGFWTSNDSFSTKVFHGWLFHILEQILMENPSLFLSHNRFDILNRYETFIDALMGHPGYGKEIRTIGGGWSTAIPFTCDDVCENITIELLASDGSGNWSKDWENISVTSLITPEVVRELPSVELSCASFNENYKNLFTAAAQYGEAGSSMDSLKIFEQIDEVFGSYRLIYVDTVAEWIDKNTVSGYLQHHPIDVNCSNVVNGQLDWEDKVLTVEDGVINNCCLAFRLDQNLEINIDDCGMGEIVRNFTLNSYCDVQQPALEFTQVIHIIEQCPISSEMFYIPNLINDSLNPFCVSSLETAAKELSIQITGSPSLLPSFENKICTSIALGVMDETIEKIENTDNYNLYRKWILKDWCSKEEIGFDQEIVFRIGEECSTLPTIENLIFGNIITEKGKSIADVKVEASTSKGITMETSTDDQGYYSFFAPDSQAVTLVPSKNINHGNGITTIDVITIQRYLLGKLEFNSRYEKIAADVDNDGSITGLDVLATRRMVLNPFGRFANNSSWRFFVNDNTMRESMLYHVASKEEKIDFIGVKIGDVNHSNNPSRSKYRHSLELRLDDRKLQAGELYTVGVRCQNFSNITGFQFSLESPDGAVKIKTIESGVLHMTEENYLMIGSDVVNISWSEAEGKDIAKDEALFFITIEAQEEVTLGEGLVLSQDHLFGEAYSADLEVNSIDWQMNRIDSNPMVLYQNRPNPFHHYTVIGFYLPYDSPTCLRVFDITGRLLWSQQQPYKAGYHEVNLDASLLNQSGMMMYQLSTDNVAITNRMVVFDR
ncbi:dockerin type I domain-containing protein [Membranihabitans marinus]|uniref:dockerin type I domain-containing protein n=1 Tax=Membranihabitans marinus TaxID=1227546 RepID=UPI001F00E9BD|nr:dockerin type I domain-containing protein [Membranihabitans marinus]